MTASDTAVQLGEILHLVVANPLGVIATTSAEGPEAALVSVAPTPAGELIVKTRADSRKVANLERDPRVAVVIGCSGGSSLQIEGTAAVVTDAETDEEYHRRFSRGVRGGEQVYLRIRPDWVRTCDLATAPPTVREGPFPIPD
ncbi:pyridoxamine 5'-phosphate oxidase family protein [Agromyces mediolanus]|uniref:pyridoxamine 5'-phosphate oxidase family protein n=1 Tax=Agromyces mediolanus TaxID=41986 RepID=UPI00203CAE7D|nr:pyridoxamine 5'-phosphate oxidase family protein [Agromyces mediolanus]MCM3656856.1 pyridoxamine 5'-phosphate oxidase family protein [Agromyces mediolanus]